jgi:hypothetical protein
MIFLSIPKNGSSWRNSLLYELDVEGDAPQDVEISILNTRSGEVLATQNLYGVSKCSVDIAPYVVEHVSLEPVVASVPTLRLSPSAISVTVMANGVASESRVFFRESFDASVPKMLTYCRQRQEVAAEDTIRITLFALSSVRAQILPITNGVASPLRVSVQTGGMPVELVVPASVFGGKDKGFTIAAYCDNEQLPVLSYFVAPKPSMAKSVVWYNTQGGIESFTFRHAIRQCLDVRSTSFDSEKFVVHRRVDSRLRYRMCTGCETTAEIERLMEVFLSPAIYRCDADGCRPLALINREVSFDANGNLHTLSLDVEQPWKGGAQW